MRFPVSASYLNSASAIISVITLAFVLQGCSAIKIAYNQAPKLVYWRLDSYVDFNQAQSLLVKDELSRLQAWHRQSQLPLYAAALHQLQQEVTADTSGERVCGVYFDIRRKLQAVSERAESAIAAWAVTVSTDQIAQLEKRFEEGNAEYRNDYLEASAKASHQRRYEQAVDRAEVLYGRLDVGQMAFIDEAVEQSPSDAKVFYAERVRRQHDAVRNLKALLLDQKNGAQTAQKAQAVVHGVIERAFNSPDAAYRDYFRKSTQNDCKTFAELHNSTNVQQREHAVKTLIKYQQDIKTLLKG